jgi:hypothetical protein
VISAYCKGGGVDLAVGTVLTIGLDITEREAKVKIAQGFVTPVIEKVPATTAENKGTETKKAGDGKTGGAGADKGSKGDGK